MVLLNLGELRFFSSANVLSVFASRMESTSGGRIDELGHRPRDDAEPFRFYIKSRNRFKECLSIGVFWFFENCC